MATTSCQLCSLENSDLIFAATGQGTPCLRHAILGGMYGNRYSWYSNQADAANQAYDYSGQADIGRKQTLYEKRFETDSERSTREAEKQRINQEAEAAVARMYEALRKRNDENLKRAQREAFEHFTRSQEAQRQAYEHHYKRAEQAQTKRQTTRIGNHDWIEQAFQATPANRHEQLYRTLATFCHPDQAGSNEAFHALSAAKEKHRRLNFF